MARPRKAGLSYFPLDVNIFEDKDVRILIERYGAAGYALYMRILCLTYGGDGYFLVIDDDWEYLIAKDIKCSRESVQQMTKYLLGRSLLVKRTINGLTCKSSTLTESVTIVTSPGIQRRYQCAIAERGRKNAVKVDGRIWLLEDEETLPFIKVSGRESFSGNNESFSGNNESFSGNNDPKKSKEKKSKEEKNIYTPSADDVWIEHPDVNAAFIRYLNIRAGGGKLMRQQVEALREQILAMSSDPAEQVKIIDQSTRAGWKGFYPLDERRGPGSGSRSNKGAFYNFDQRSYDYAELERQLVGGGS